MNSRNASASASGAASPLEKSKTAAEGVDLLKAAAEKLSGGTPSIPEAVEKTGSV